MTPFEQGYAAFLRGQGLTENPFNKETSPHSLSRWNDGLGQSAARPHAAVALTLLSENDHACSHLYVDHRIPPDEIQEGCDYLRAAP